MPLHLFLGRRGFGAVLVVLAACAGSPTRSDPIGTEAVQLETPTGTIHGTLELPGGVGPHPVVVIVAGSGPTDRDGNSVLVPGANNSLKMLAEGLAANGVASVRYDKRGVGQSRRAAPSEADLRFDTYATDAAHWVERLKGDARFAAVGVAGHSEGSLLGMLAADRAGADFFVSLAGAGERASDLLRRQLRPQLPPELWLQSERILAALEAGRTADSVPDDLMPLFRPSVQPYLISWFRYHPPAEIARLTVPVLIIHGTTDVQVGVEQAYALHAARPDAKLQIVEGMNHILKRVPADPERQQASYSDPTLPVVPEVVEGVAQIARSATRAR